MERRIRNRKYKYENRSAKGIAGGGGVTLKDSR